MRGQLLSVDALLSLVLVIMILGTVSATSESLKGEITSMIGWYERANIADNMLDVLTKTPGEPEDWEKRPTIISIPGLKSNNSEYLDYDKVMALNSSKDVLKEALAKICSKKDFLLEVYISHFEVSANGQFPRVYLFNKTFQSNTGKEGVNFEISRGEGNNYFKVSYIELKRDGVKYLNEELCGLTRANSNNLILETGDVIKIIVAENVDISSKGSGTSEEYPIPADSIIEIHVDSAQSNLMINFYSCPYELKFTGKGNVIVTVSAYSTPDIKISKTYKYATALVGSKEPTYYFGIVNGNLLTDISEIKSSMEKSSWINTADRVLTIQRMKYDLSGGPSGTQPIVYGVLTFGTYKNSRLQVSAPNTKGNLTFIIASGPQLEGVMIYREEENKPLNAIIVKDENTVLSYTGTETSISIPLEDVIDQTNAFLGIWLYSLKGWARREVGIDITPSIKWAIKPRLEPVIIKLWVWDDR